MITVEVYGKKNRSRTAGKSDVINVDAGTCKIGRHRINDIVLSDTAVSTEHAAIINKNGEFFIYDLNSRQGTYVDAYRLPPMQKIKLKKDAVVNIGRYQLRLRPADTRAQKSNTAGPGAFSHRKTPLTGKMDCDPKFDVDPKMIQLKTDIHQQLLEIIELRRLDFNKTSDVDLRNQCTAIVNKIIADSRNNILNDCNRDVLIKDILDEALGLGPLEDLLADDDVSEIMVNRPDRIYVEKNGKIYKSPKIFSNTKSVSRIISRIVGPLGRRVDESSPMVDARLEDGSRVNVVIPPLALDGPCLTIRKFAKTPLTVEEMIRLQSVSPEMMAFIKNCVLYRKNILIAGGTGSGKTTALNVLSSFIPDGERIVTIEDAAELQLPQDHVIRLEARPPNIEDKGEITIRQLVKNALRMRPDRIIIGECRGGEALDMLQAMNTGHDGSITTVHANSPKDVVSRLEIMVLQSGTDLPARAIRRQIASALDIVIQQVRFSCGSRKITTISEVVGMDGDDIALQDIFFFRQKGPDAQGNISGSFLATGWIPDFYGKLQQNGVSVDMGIFHN